MSLHYILMSGFDSSAILHTLLTTGITTAIISTAIGGLIKYFFDKRQRHIQFNIDIKKSEQSARQTYEYEARMRIYKDVEPILFHFLELSQMAYRRIYILGEESNEGSPSYEKHEKRFKCIGTPIRKTAYELLAPMAAFNILRKRLTIFDITLVPSIYFQYMIGKTILHTFYDDEEIAKSEHQISYPHIDNYYDKQINKPEKQGISPISMERMLDFLIDSNDKCRVINLEEFLNKIEEPSSSSKKDVFEEKIFKRLINFKPDNKPVLWRILLIQTLLYKSLQNSTKPEYSKYFLKNDIKESHIFKKSKGYKISQTISIKNTFNNLIKDQLKVKFKPLYLGKTEYKSFDAIRTYLDKKLEDL